MRAYQCSRCDKLLDLDDYCTCSVLGDMRPGHRWKGAAKNRYWGSHTYRSDKLASRFRTQSEDMTHINPDYAEVYMGFPMGWTVLDHWEMQ